MAFSGLIFRKSAYSKLVISKTFQRQIFQLRPPMPNRPRFSLRDHFFSVSTLENQQLSTPNSSPDSAAWNPIVTNSSSSNHSLLHSTTSANSANQFQTSATQVLSSPNTHLNDTAPPPIQAYKNVTALNKKLVPKIEHFARFNPTPMSVQNFILFGKSAHERDSFRFLINELPVRLANMIAEFGLMSSDFLKMPSVQIVRNWYEQSFADMLEFETVAANSKDKAALSEAALNKFTRTIANIYERHQFVVETLAQGVIEFKERSPDGELNQVFDAQLQYFLDRFYMSRISIRMLIHQHVLLFGKKAGAKKLVAPKSEMVSGREEAALSESARQIGCIDPHCDVISMVQEAYENARLLAERYYIHMPPSAVPRMLLTATSVDKKDVPAAAKDAKTTNTPASEATNSSTSTPSESNGKTLPDIRITYVPSHLYYLLFEIFKNSLRAVIENSIGDVPLKPSYKPITLASPLPSLQVHVCKGKDDITIRISDEGGGFSIHHLDTVFRYSFTTARRPRSTIEPQSSVSSEQTAMPTMDPPLAGYGYGLPLSRLYARYFGGELHLSPREGHGVDAYVYLKRDPAQAGELLPVFNATAARLYHVASIPVNDWSTISQPSTNGHSNSGSYAHANSILGKLAKSPSQN